MSSEKDTIFRKRQYFPSSATYIVFFGKISRYLVLCMEKFQYIQCLVKKIPIHYIMGQYIHINQGLNKGVTSSCVFFLSSFKKCVFSYTVLALFWQIGPLKHVFWTIHGGYPDIFRPRFSKNCQNFLKLAFDAVFGAWRLRDPHARVHNWWGWGRGYCPHQLPVLGKPATSPLNFGIRGQRRSSRGQMVCVLSDGG